MDNSQSILTEDQISVMTAMDFYRNTKEELANVPFLHPTNDPTLFIGISVEDSAGSNVEYRAKSKFELALVRYTDQAYYEDLNNYADNLSIIQELYLVLRAVAYFNSNTISFYEFKTYLSCEAASKEIQNDSL